MKAVNQINKIMIYDCCGNGMASVLAMSAEDDVFNPQTKDPKIDMDSICILNKEMT